MIAARAITPTTTPAAIPAVLVPPPDDFAVAEGSLDAVTTIVCPAWVMTVTPAVVEVVAELVVLLLEPSAIGTSDFNPVR